MKYSIKILCLTLFISVFISKPTIGRAGMPIDQFNVDQTWTPDASIYYTLDGSEPDINSLQYTGPIVWESTYRLRAKAFRSDLDESRLLEIDGDFFTSNSETSADKIQASLVAAFPNPSSFETTVRYFLPEGSAVEIQLSNVAGKVVHSFARQNKTAGYHLQKIEIGDLASGVYFVRMEVEGVAVSPLKLMVIR